MRTLLVGRARPIRIGATCQRPDVRRRSASASPKPRAFTGRDDDVRHDRQTAQRSDGRQARSEAATVVRHVLMLRQDGDGRHDAAASWRGAA
jgi:hypothetical protein